MIEPTPLLATAALALIALLLIVVLLRRAGRANGAFITTSRLGRVTTVLGLSVSAARRKVSSLLGRIFLGRARREARDRQMEQEAAREIVKAMGDMKGVLMKLGQIVSFMDDAVPEVYRAELANLQANAPPMSWDLVRAQLRLELGDDLDSRFRSIEEAPLAAASIGQVHRAVLRDGTRVAVKVQYPGVDRAITADLANYEMMQTMIQAVTPTMDAAPMVQELHDRFTEELDYEREAENQEMFQRLYAGHAHIHVPRVFREHSSRRVLTTELVEGGVGFYEFAEKAVATRKREAVLAIYTFAFDSIYRHGVFNGDPHPGNYLFLPDGRVAFLDFGCVKRFPESFLAGLKELNRLYLLGERNAYREQMIAMRYILPAGAEKVDADWLWEYMRYYYLPIVTDEPFAMTPAYCKQAIGAMFGPAMRRMNMPPDFVLLNRINFGLNSIFARLGARENFHRLARGYFLREGDDERWERARREHAATPAG